MRVAKLSFCAFAPKRCPELCRGGTTSRSCRSVCRPSLPCWRTQERTRDHLPRCAAFLSPWARRLKRAHREEVCSLLAPNISATTARRNPSGTHSAPFPTCRITPGSVTLFERDGWSHRKKLREDITSEPDDLNPRQRGRGQNYQLLSTAKSAFCCIITGNDRTEVLQRLSVHRRRYRHMDENSSSPCAAWETRYDRFRRREHLSPQIEASMNDHPRSQRAPLSVPDRSCAAKLLRHMLPSDPSLTVEELKEYCTNSAARCPRTRWPRIL